MEVKADLPPVIKKSEVFMAASIVTIEMNDMDKAVVRASCQLNFSRTRKRTDSSASEVPSPAIMAITICNIIGVPGKNACIITTALKSPSEQPSKQFNVLKEARFQSFLSSQNGATTPSAMG